MEGRIVILSGPPGAGKSTAARALAERSDLARAVHFHTDDFYGYIRKGYVDPWLPEASHQNEVIANALVAVSGAYAAGGYEVFVDGIVGPWLLAPWHPPPWLQRREERCWDCAPTTIYSPPGRNPVCRSRSRS